jgi:hypothetical protein
LQGTLTLNELSLRDPIIIKAGVTAADIVFNGALASKRKVRLQPLVLPLAISLRIHGLTVMLQEGNQDAIDLCITGAMSAEQKQLSPSYKEIKFTPFNPVVRLQQKSDWVCPERTLYCRTSARRPSFRAPTARFSRSPRAHRRRVT